jgi:hypothetical protein
MHSEANALPSTLANKVALNLELSQGFFPKLAFQNTSKHKSPDWS